MTRTTSHKWAFAARFRRAAFGWKSALPIQRLKEALIEIRQIARADPVLAADGAVALLEKLSPALEHVDNSSGAIGTAVNRAIDALVPVIAGVDVPAAVRMRWLERLFDALQNDRMPYIEQLGDRWGDLCTSPAIASSWADRLLPVKARVMGAEGLGAYFSGTTACFSALNAARRHEELLALVNGARLNWWGYRQYGVDALIALNRSAEALRYAEASRGLNAPTCRHRPQMRSYPSVRGHDGRGISALRDRGQSGHHASRDIPCHREKISGQESRQHPPRSGREQSGRRG